MRRKPKKEFVFKGDASGEGGMRLEAEGLGGVEGDTRLEGGIDGTREGGSTLEGFVQVEVDVIATQTSMSGPTTNEPTTQSSTVEAVTHEIEGGDENV